jgi:predicted ATPase
MRIAVVGPQNVGKTTFVQDFVLKFPEYTSYKSSLKTIADEKGLQINQLSGEETQFLIMEHLYKMISEEKQENVIFDRCLIDNLAYTLAAQAKGKVSDEFVEVSREKMFEHLQFLDYIFFIPTSLVVNLEEDKYRDIDKNYIDLVNKYFIEILLEISKRFSIKILVLSGSREERIKEISTQIK